MKRIIKLYRDNKEIIPIIVFYIILLIVLIKFFLVLFSINVPFLNEKETHKKNNYGSLYEYGDYSFDYSPDGQDNYGHPLY